MELLETQKAAAYLVGRAIAAETAVKTLMAERHRDAVTLRQLLRANLDYRQMHMAADFERTGLDAALLSVAQTAFAITKKAALQAVVRGRYIEPDVQGASHVQAVRVTPKRRKKSCA